MYCLARSREEGKRWAKIVAIVAAALFCPMSGHSENVGVRDQKIIGEIVTEKEPFYVFFAPFDAPYLVSGYEDRINAILNSITSSGERSELGDPVVDEYRKILHESRLPSYRLTPNGKSILKDSLKWLVDAGGRETEGYAQYRRLYIDVVNADSDGNLVEFRDALIRLFAEGRALTYVNAEQIRRTLQIDPVKRFYRDLLGRSARVDTDNVTPYLLFPSPDDIDLAENWRPVVMRAAGKKELISASGVYIEVISPEIDALAEVLTIQDGARDFLLPSRLLVVRNLSFIPGSTLPNVSDNAIEIQVPEAKFNTYAETSIGGSSTTFLLCAELKRRHL
ncbi:hypothetical protein [Rhizobium leguminosarum]|uniref:hypothetical protein n=1 Tax=Rhizobium leguminosarum TaxID=384 RepID=UPI0010320C9B|nr:hypothetical protein [Rhizobium leguminosarum]TBF65684.1 hypothetical protein ELG89_34585 [Rhizobium leguminosarum]